MKVGIVSASNVQSTLIREELSVLIDSVTVFSIADIEAGLARTTNQHILIYDLTDESILDSAELLEEMTCEEPKSIVNDADLFPMSADQRIAWRNKTIGEMKKIAPDLVEDLRSAAEKVAASKVETLLIGSSSGGPMALKEFFANLPRLNIAIFIAQHMPEAAYDLVLNQVKSSARNWDVSIAVHGEKALAGHAYLIPREVTLSISANSVIEFKPNATTPEFHPCINNAVRSIYSYSKDKTNIVILTGMGEDGAAALRELKGKARMILAQEPDSCASSSMPDAARKTNTVDRSGTPSELANLISESYGHGVSFLN